MLRRIVYLFLFLFGIAAFGQEAAPKKLRQVTVWTSWKQQAQFAGVYMAKELGYYEALGLDVAIDQRAPRTDILPALTSGKADIVMITLPEAIILNEQNPDVISFGQICQHTSMGIVTLKKDGLDSIAKLNNVRMAAWPGPISIFLELFLAENNVKPKILYSAFAEEIMLWEVVQTCIVMRYHEYRLLMLNGILEDEMKVYYFKDYGMDIPEDGMFALRSKFADDPDVLRKFNEATMRGWRKAFEDEEATLKIVRKYAIPYSQNVQSWMLHEMKSPVLAPDRTPGVLNRESYDKTAALLLKHGKIKAIPKFEDFYIGPSKGNANGSGEK